MKLTQIWVPSVEMTYDENKMIKKGDLIEGKKIVQLINDNQELLLEGETVFRIIILTRPNSL